MRSFGASLLGKLLLLFTLSLTALTASASRPTGEELSPRKLEPSVLEMAEDVPFHSDVEVELALSLQALQLGNPVFVVDRSGNLIYKGQVDDFVKPNPDIQPGCCGGTDGRIHEFEVARPLPPGGPICCGGSDQYVSLSPALQIKVQKTLIEYGMTGGAITIYKGKFIKFTDGQVIEEIKQEAKILDKPIFGPKDLPTDT